MGIVLAATFMFSKILSKSQVEISIILYFIKINENRSEFTDLDSNWMRLELTYGEVKNVDQFSNW
jgi:hypothetical protein